MWVLENIHFNETEFDISSTQNDILDFATALTYQRCNHRLLESTDVKCLLMVSIFNNIYAYQVILQSG